MTRREDLTGRIFKDLTVVRYYATVRGRAKWVCVCVCGTEVIAQAGHLKSGDVRSCGCWRNGRQQIKHGMTGSSEHTTFLNIKARTGNPNHIGWRDYGGRGIKCLYGSFDEFFSDVGPKPSPNHTIDRINVDGHYEPGNCRWATPREQTRNKRNTVHLVTPSGDLCLVDAAREAGLKPGTVSYRIRRGKRGLDPLRPTFTPKTYELDGKKMSLREWADLLGISADTLRNRFNLGWSAERAFREPVRGSEVRS